MEEGIIICTKEINQNIRNVFDGKPLTRPLRVLNNNCKFRERYELACDLKYGSIKKAYNQKPEVKAYRKAYNQKPEVKAYKKAYQKAYYQKPEVKAYRKAYNQKPEVKAYKKAYYQKKKEVLK